MCNACEKVVRIISSSKFLGTNSAIFVFLTRSNFQKQVANMLNSVVTTTDITVQFKYSFTVCYLYFAGDTYFFRESIVQQSFSNFIW